MTLAAPTGCVGNFSAISGSVAGQKCAPVSQQGSGGGVAPVYALVQELVRQPDNRHPEQLVIGLSQIACELPQQHRSCGAEGRRAVVLLLTIQALFASLPPRSRGQATVLAVGFPALPWRRRILFVEEFILFLI